MNLINNNSSIIILTVIIFLVLGGLSFFIIRKLRLSGITDQLEAADNFYRNGEYEKGLALYLKALPIVESLYGYKGPKTADTYMKIGKSYIHLSKLETAEEYVFRANDYYKNLLDSDPSEAASYYNTLGNINDSLKRYDAALKYYQKSLEILNSLTDSKSSDTAKCYLNIAIVYDNQKKYKESVAMYQKAIAIFEKDEHNIEKVIALSYFNLGVALYIQNKFDTALDCLEKSLLIRQQTLDEHPDIANCYHYIACVKLEINQLDEAIKLLLKSLKIKATTLGNRHPEYWKTYFKLKNAYLKSGNSKSDFESWIDEKLLEFKNE
jgi:tetratricopeptide (TPR) repeat protein